MKQIRKFHINEIDSAFFMGFLRYQNIWPLINQSHKIQYLFLESIIKIERLLGFEETDTFLDFQFKWKAKVKIFLKGVW